MKKLFSGLNESALNYFSETHNTVAHSLMIGDANLADLDITDVVQDSPLLAALATDECSHPPNVHKYPKEITAPVVGFRAIGSGKQQGKSVDDLTTITLQLLSANDITDKALADGHRFGKDAYIARELQRKLRAAFAGGERQIFYGTGAETDGFVGLNEADGLNAIADDMVKQGGGATADVQSSIWLIRTNDLGTDCQLILGKEGQIEIGDTQEQMINDSNGNPQPVYTTSQEGFLGVQIGSKHSVGRIANLEVGSTVNDDLISAGFLMFPATKKPNLIVMNEQLQENWRQSRTATNENGNPAPMPEVFRGARVIVTDNLQFDQAVVA